MEGARLGRGGGGHYSAVSIQAEPGGPGGGVDQDPHHPWRRFAARVRALPASLLMALAGVLVSVLCIISFWLGKAYATHGALENNFYPKDVKTLFTAFHLTDAHIDPLYLYSREVRKADEGVCRNEACCVNGEDKCKPFTYSELDPPSLGCDPPIQLLDSALQTMLAIDPHARFLLFTGDMPAHHLCTESMVRITQREFLRRVHQHFPRTPLLFAIGNNDLWPNSKNDRPNFSSLYNIVKDECPQCAIFQGPTATANKATFLQGGFYVYIDGGLSVRILVLNSGLFCPKYTSDLDSGMPDEHLDWIEEQLAEARKSRQQVLIISHVPPGHVGHTADWVEPYLSRFIAICSDYSDVIRLQLYGHHSKEYIRSFNEKVGVLVSSGLTPLGGGSLEVPGAKDPANPTFKLTIFTREALYDIWTFFMDLSAGQGSWASRLQHDHALPLSGSSTYRAAIAQAQKRGWDLMFSFRETYKVPDISGPSLKLAANRILHDSKYLSRYQSYMAGLHSIYRLVACDVHTVTWRSSEEEQCYDRMCSYDVSQTCA